jgi:hypothetical protein
VKPTFEVVYKRPRIPKGTPLPYTCEVELENGAKAKFTQCPDAYLVKSKQYELDAKKRKKLRLP